MQFYDRAFVFINGQLLGEAESVSVQYQGEHIPIATLVKDLAGVTPVPKSAVIEVTSFVPAKGFEQDAVKLFLEGTFVKVRVQFGGSGIKMTAEGIVQPPNVSASATDASRISFSILCEARPFE